MKEIELFAVSCLFDRMSEAAPLIQVILGPRQIGKTTTIQQFCERLKKKPYHSVSAEGVESPFWISEQWQKAKEHDAILIIDEIQKVPNCSEMIKKLWDEDKKRRKKTKCILLGSSSLSLNKGLSESLAGRFELIRMHHWGAQESKDLAKLSLEDFLVYGGYPGSYQFLKQKQRWVEFIRGSIIESVLGKDILLQAKVKSPALFRQAFYLLTSYPAQVVSYNKLLGQLQDKGNIDQIKYYIELLESAFLIKTIPKYSGGELRKKISSAGGINYIQAMYGMGYKFSLNQD